MAGLQNTRRQGLPTPEEALQIVEANNRDYLLRNTETGDMMPMRLATKDMREYFGRPTQPAQAAAQPTQAAPMAQARNYTSDDYKQTYIKELRQAGYSDRAIAAMMGVAEGETGFTLKGLVEHGRYTKPSRIVGQFGGKKPSIIKQAKNIAGMDEEGQYNAFYDERADLGNVKPGDGYLYRGRGMTHITGRQAYENVDNFYKTGGTIAKNPDIVAQDPVWAARSAIAFLNQPEKMGNRRDFGLKDVLPLVGGSRDSWPIKNKAAKRYYTELRRPTMMASNP
jgi:predicted chitinase